MAVSKPGEVTKPVTRKVAAKMVHQHASCKDGDEAPVLWCHQCGAMEPLPERGSERADTLKECADDLSDEMHGIATDTYDEAMARMRDLAAKWRGKE